MSETIKARVRALLLNRERGQQYREALKKILAKEKELEEKYPDNPEWRAWEIVEVGVPPWVVMKLLQYGIVECVYSSSRHRYYRLADKGAVAKALAGPEKRRYVTSAAGARSTGAEADGKVRVPDSPENLFDVVVGYDDYKWLLWKAIKKWSRGAKPAHFLLVGDPATGKTFMLECIEERVGRTVYVAGEAARRGGFVDRLLEAHAKYGKKFILIIDEIDKLDSEALKILHNIMEGRLDIPVHGKELSVKDVRIMVLATSNQPSRIPETILSRFGEPLVFTLYNREEYIEVVKRVLTRLESINEDLARYIAEKTAELGVRDPRVARQIARTVDTKEEVEKAIKILFKKKPRF